MNLNLQDKTVIVTGGAAGIGRATAERFESEGARVVVWDVTGDKAVDDTNSLCDFRLEYRKLEQLGGRPGLLASSRIRHLAIYDYRSLHFWIDLLSHFDQQQHILRSPIIGE